MNNCPVCSITAGKLLGEKNGFDILRCKTCGSLFSNKKDEAITASDYSEYYNENNLTVPAFTLDVIGEVIAKFDSYRQNNRLLDVGCGAGSLLEKAAELNWEVEGVEVSSSAVESLRRKNLKVFHGTLTEAAYPDDYFDVVTASEVIEHVEDPAEVLREIARILRPKGLLWMTTPNGNGISTKVLGTNWSVIAPPEHLHLFSAKGLRKLLTEAGFSDCRFDTHGFNPFEVYHFFRGQSAKANQSETNAAPDIEFDRVQNSYRLNQWMMSGKNTKRLKGLLNFTLNTSRLGDNLKIWATL